MKVTTTYRLILVTEEVGCSGLSLRSDDFDSVGELYTFTTSLTSRPANELAEPRILSAASESFVEAIPAHPGDLSEFSDVPRLHDDLDRIQNAV